VTLHFLVSFFLVISPVILIILQWRRLLTLSLCLFILSVSGSMAHLRNIHQFFSTTWTPIMQRYLPDTEMPYLCVSYLLIQIRTLIAKYQWRPAYPSAHALLAACAENPDPLQIRYFPSRSSSDMVFSSYSFSDKGFSLIMYNRSSIICPNGRMNDSLPLEFHSPGWVLTHLPEFSFLRSSSVLQSRLDQ